MRYLDAESCRPIEVVIILLGLRREVVGVASLRNTKYIHTQYTYSNYMYLSLKRQLFVKPSPGPTAAPALR